MALAVDALRALPATERRPATCPRPAIGLRPARIGDVSAVLDPALSELRARAAGRARAAPDRPLRPLRGGEGHRPARAAPARPGAARGGAPAPPAPGAPRSGTGADYQFLSPEAFATCGPGTSCWSSAEYAGHCYGTPKADVREAFARGEDALLKIEVQGAAQVKASYPQTVMIFLAPPDLGGAGAAPAGAGGERPGRPGPAPGRGRGTSWPRSRTTTTWWSTRSTASPRRPTRWSTIIRAERCRVGVPPVRL